MTDFSHIQTYRLVFVFKLITQFPLALEPPATVPTSGQSRPSSSIMQIGSREPEPVATNCKDHQLAYQL